MYVTVVYEEPNQILDYKFPENTILLDQNSLKTRKKAFSNKGAIAARLTPCCVVRNDDDVIIKGFYKEASQDPIQECLDWMISNG